MHKIIRDDVISIEGYTAAAFKYDSLLETLFGVGGYVFIVQLKELYGDNQAKYMIKGAEKVNLIKTATYSNYKYIYLTSTATKYLASKRLAVDEPIITYKKIDHYPTDRKLFTSAFKWHLLQEGYTFLISSQYEHYLKNYLETKSKYRSAEELELDKKDYIIKNYQRIVQAKSIALQLVESNDALSKQIAKQLAHEVLENKNTVNEFDKKIKDALEFKEKESKKITKGVNLFKISKIVLLPDQDCLRLIIFDVGEIKAISAYITNIESFEKCYGIKFPLINIEFITYDEERFKRFEQKVKIASDKDKKKALTIASYKPSLEYFQKIRNSKSIAEGIIKEKDQGKFDEIIESMSNKGE